MSSAQPSAPGPGPVVSAAAGGVAIPEDRTGTFPGEKVGKARMFDSIADCARPVGDDGQLCAGLTKPGVGLAAVQLERLILLLTDDRAFSQTPAKCSEPTHSVVFFNEQDVPIGYISVSIPCGALTSRPTLAGKRKHGESYSLTKAAVDYVRGLCKKHGLSGCDAKELTRK